MAVCGVTAVCSRVMARPSNACTSAVTSSSILPWLLASVTSQPLTGSIHTQALLRRGKACGNRVSSASSRRALVSFLPGLRPVVASMWSASSWAFSRTTEPGTLLDSIMNFRMRWPATASTSGPCASPRGSTQPTALSCEAPQGTKRAASSAASIASGVGAQPGAMRYSVTFLNTKFLANRIRPDIGPACDLRGRSHAVAQSAATSTHIF